MDRRRLAKRSCWLMASGLGLLLLGVFGCDAVAPPVVFSASENSDEALQSAATGNDHSPEMESVGPEDAKRIYYQFVDGRGRVRFVERLADVPEAWRAQMGYVEMSQPPPLTPQEARKTWQISTHRATEIMLASATMPSGTGQIRTQREDVVLYFATWCGYCTKARAHLDAAGIQYELRNVDNGAIGRELREKTGRSGIPVLDFSGEILRGYSADAYDKAIRTIRG